MENLSTQKSVLLLTVFKNCFGVSYCEFRPYLTQNTVGVFMLLGLMRFKTLLAKLTFYLKNVDSLKVLLTSIVFHHYFKNPLCYD